MSNRVAGNILIQQIENVQERRQIRFANIDKIVKLHMPLKQYTLEAIEIEKLGLTIDF